MAQIDKVLGTDAWKAGGFKIEVREGSNKKIPARSEEKNIHRTIYSRYVIWCGGEWVRNIKVESVCQLPLDSFSIIA